MTQTNPFAQAFKGFAGLTDEDIELGQMFRNARLVYKCTQKRQEKLLPFLILNTANREPATKTNALAC